MAKLERVRTAQHHPNSPREFADTSGHSTGAPEGRMIDVDKGRGDVAGPTVLTPALTRARQCLICKFRRPVVQRKEGGDA